MSSQPAEGVPAPLIVAASLVTIEGLGLLAYGVLEIFSVANSRIAVAVTTAVFFAVYAAGLLFCAWSVTRQASWARSPILLAQLIQLGVAWSFRGGDTTLVAIGLAVVAVIVIGGVLHPASIEHLAEE